jgi:uncharacterized membrane protein YgcG
LKRAVVLFLFPAGGVKSTQPARAFERSAGNTSRMGTRTHIIYISSLAILLSACATMQPTAGVRDDVYFMPSDAPAQAATPRQQQQERQQQQQAQTDDYYDPGTASNYATPRSYYDMAYNDPYYYNYGRFGFGGGMGMGMGMGMGTMGWQSGWGGPGWGMGMGYGWGSGMGMGMYDPWMMGGMYDPWMMGGMGMGMRPGMGMGMGMRPWGMYDPWMGGYGWGNYYGPYGNCFACYSPVIVGGSSGVVVGHRPSSGRTGTTGPGGPVHQPRSMQSSFRDPVGLTPVTRGDDLVRQPAGTRGDGPSRLGSGRSIDRQPSLQQPRTQPGRDGRGGFEPRGGGGFDRGGGGMPSRSGGGGGSRPMTSPRPR